MKTVLALIALFTIAAVAPVATAQESLVSRLSQVEANNAVIVSSVTKLQSEVSALRAEVAELRKVNAAAPQSAAVSWSSPQTVDWSGVSAGGTCANGQCGVSGGFSGRVLGGFFRRR